MKTNIRNYRGGVTLGLLAISLFNLSPRLLAEEAPEGKLNRWEKRFDVNQDGKLDAQETAAKEVARKDAFQRLQGRYDQDGDQDFSLGRPLLTEVANRTPKSENFLQLKPKLKLFRPLPPQRGEKVKRRALALETTIKTVQPCRGEIISPPALRDLLDL